MDAAPPPIEQPARRDLGSAAIGLGASIGLPNLIDVVVTAKMGPLASEVALLPPPFALVVTTARARVGLAVPVSDRHLPSGRDVEWMLGAMVGGTIITAPLEWTAEVHRAVGVVGLAERSVWIRPKTAVFVRITVGADRWSSSGVMVGQVGAWAPAAQVGLGVRFTAFPRSSAP